MSSVEGLFRPPSAARCAAVLFAVLTAGALVVSLFTAPAAAQDSGIDRLIQNPDLQAGNQPTVQERYSSGSYIVPYLPEDTFGPDLGTRVDNATSSSANFIAEQLVAGAALSARMSIAVIQWAFDGRVTGWIAESVSDFVEGLGDTLFGPFLVFLVVLGVLWVAWHGLVKRRGSQSTQGLVWMVLATAFALFFISQPRMLLEGANDLATSSSNAIFSAFAGVIGAGSQSGGDYYGEQAPTFEGNTRSEAARRQLADNVWRVIVYEPWRTAAFHNDADADRYGEALLADPSTQNVEWVRDQLVADYGDGAVQAAYFEGRQASSRITVGLLAVTAAVVTGLVLTVIGASVLLLQLASLLLTITAPLFLLVGVQPGVGRNIMLRWLEMWLSTHIKRIVLTAVLAAVIAVNGLIVRNVLDLSWFVAALLIVLVGVAAIVYRKPFVAMLSQLGVAGMAGSAPQDPASAIHEQRSRSGSTLSRVAKKTAIGKVAYLVGRRVGSTGTAGDPNAADDGRDGASPEAPAATGTAAGVRRRAEGVRAAGRRSPADVEGGRVAGDPVAEPSGRQRHAPPVRVTRSPAPAEPRQPRAPQSGLAEQARAQANPDNGRLELSPQGQERLAYLRDRQQHRRQDDDARWAPQERQRRREDFDRRLAAKSDSRSREAAARRSAERGRETQRQQQRQEARRNHDSEAARLRQEAERQQRAAQRRSKR